MGHITATERTGLAGFDTPLGSGNAGVPRQFPPRAGMRKSKAAAGEAKLSPPAGEGRVVAPLRAVIRIRNVGGLMMLHAERRLRGCGSGGGGDGVL